jgi:transposase
MGSRRLITKEFKAEAVALVKQHGLSISKAAKDLGVSWSMVKSWVDRSEIDAGLVPGPLTTAEREELNALRKQLRVVTMEREILKKATAFFAKESD